MGFFSNEEPFEAYVKRDETLKLLWEQLQRQQEKIDTLMKDIITKEEELSCLKIKNSRLILRNDELKDSAKTLLEVEAQLKETEYERNSYRVSYDRMKDLEAELKRKDNEVQYLKNYVKELQNMPPYEKILAKITEFKIPDITELIQELSVFNNCSKTKCNSSNEKIWL